jgi:hypothetical protein
VISVWNLYSGCCCRSCTSRALSPWLNIQYPHAMLNLASLVICKQLEIWVLSSDHCLWVSAFRLRKQLAKEQRTHPAQRASLHTKVPTLCRYSTHTLQVESLVFRSRHDCSSQVCLSFLVPMEATAFTRYRSMSQCIWLEQIIQGVNCHIKTIC